MNKLRRYWDAACCHGYLQNRAGQVALCDRVLEEAEKGHCEILISALTIAEVLHIKGEPKSIPRATREKIRKFFQRSYFVVADVDRAIAEMAQDVFWDHSIMPKDAIHVATAVTHGAHFLETFDGHLLSKSRLVGGDPQLVIQHPGADLIAKEEAERRRTEPGFFSSDLLS